MKKLASMILAAVFTVAMAVTTASAGGWGGHYDMPLEKKVYKKVMMLKEHQKELKVSDQDLQKFVDLKIALKKDLIRAEADLEIVKLDLKVAKKAPAIDLGAVNALLDQKYEIKKNKAKRIFAAYAELKGMLSEDQKTKMKEIWGEKMQGKGAMCPMCAKKKK